MDLYKDRSKVQLQYLMSILTVPEYVKQAQISQDLSDLPSSAFAGNREFPVHRKAAAWLSCNYFFLNKEKIASPYRDRIEHKLAKAASSWGLDFDEMKTAFDHAVEEAQEPVEWALVTKDAQGEEAKLYPITNLESLKMAAEHFYRYRNSYPYTWRRAIARKLLEKIGNYEGMILPNQEYLFKAAGYGSCSPQKASCAFMARAYLLDGEDARTVEQFAEEVKNARFDHKTHTKYAELLAGIDESQNLTELYDRGLNMPEEEMFAQTVTEAKEALQKTTRLPNGSIVWDDQLERTELIKAARAVSPEFVGKILHGTIFPDLATVKKALAQLSPKEADTFMLFVPRDSAHQKKLEYLTR